MAIRVSFGAKQLALDASWGLRKSYKLGAALATIDHRLPSPAPRPSQSAAAVLYLKNTGKLRALHRPDAFSGSWEKLWASVARCRNGAATLVAVFGWPQVAGLFLDELAALDASAADTVAGMGNAGIALTRLAWSSPHLAGAGEISFDAAGARAVESYADSVFGGRKQRTKPRKHVSWGRGSMRAFVYERQGRRVVGSTFGGAKVAWRLEHSDGKRLGKPPLVRAVIDIERALSDLGSATLGSALSRRYGKILRIVTEVRNGALVFSARVRKK